MCKKLLIQTAKKGWRNRGFIKLKHDEIHLSIVRTGSKDIR